MFLYGYETLCLREKKTSDKCLKIKCSGRYLDLARAVQVNNSGYHITKNFLIYEGHVMVFKR